MASGPAYSTNPFFKQLAEPGYGWINPKPQTASLGQQEVTPGQVMGFVDFPGGMNTYDPRNKGFSYTDPASLGYTTPTASATDTSGSKNTLDPDVIKKMWQ